MPAVRDHLERRAGDELLHPPADVDQAPGQTPPVVEPPPSPVGKVLAVVFLLSAEERGLLLLGDERYEARDPRYRGVEVPKTDVTERSA